MVKTKKRFVCEDCEKELKNARALVGHMWFAHGRRVGEKTSLYDNIKTLEREKGTNPDTIERIEKIENIVGDVVKLMGQLVSGQERLTDLIKKSLESSNPGNPGNPGDKKKDKSDDDDELPDIITPILEWLFGSDKDKSDDEKKSEENDDDNSSFL